MVITSSTTSVHGALENLKNWDSDLRFMALSDIITILKSNDPMMVGNEAVMTLVVNGVLEQLDDKISDVQNMAVKCVEAIAQHCSEAHIGTIVTNLRRRVITANGLAATESTSTSPTTKTDTDNDNSVIAMAIRTVILAVEAKVSLGQLLVKSLLPNMFADASQQSLETMEILSDLIRRFGPTMTDKDTEQLQSLLLQVIKGEQGLIRKRAVSCLGLLARYTSSASWTLLGQFLDENLVLAPNADAHSASRVIACMQLCGALAKSEPLKFRPQVSHVIPQIVASLDMDNVSEWDPSDETVIALKENALNALENVVVLDMHVVEPYVDELIDIAAALIRFNPNTIQDEDDENDEDEDDDGEGDMHDHDIDIDEEDDEDDVDLSDAEDAFSDDEDQSWRLRRSAAKLAAALTKSNFTLGSIYSKLLAPLIKALSVESENTVEFELINTLDAMIRASQPDAFYEQAQRKQQSRKRRSSDVSMSAGSDPQYLLSQSSRKIIGLALKRLTHRSTSLHLIQAYIDKIVIPLVVALDGIGETDLGRLLDAMLQLAKTKQSCLGDVFSFLDTCRVHLSHDVVQKHADVIVSIISIGLEQPYHKLCLKALDVVEGICGTAPSSTTPIPQLSRLVNAVQHICVGSSFALETREKAIRVLGQLVASLPELDKQTYRELCNCLLTLLSGASTRHAATDAIGTICFGPSAAAIVDATWVETALSEMSDAVGLAKKAQVLSALKTIHLLLSKQPCAVQALDTTYKKLVAALLARNSKEGSDPQVIELSCIVLSDIVSLLNLTDTDISDFALGLIDHSSLTSFSTDSQLTLISAIVKCASLDERQRLYDILCKPTRRESQKLGAMVFATLLTQGDMLDRVADLEAAVQRGRLTDNLDWVLLVLGSVGEQIACNIDLGHMYSLVMNDEIDETNRILAGETIGKIASSNVPVYCNDLLKYVSQRYDSPIVQYAFVRALKELVASSSKTELEPYRTAIWQTVAELTSGSSTDNSNMNATVAECLGRLSLLAPEEFLPKLQSMLQSSATTRSIVISAIKSTFSRTQTDYDALLEPIIADFLSLMEDPELSVRQVALSALAGAIHNKPYLLSSHLHQLLPLLYRETVVNKELVHQVQMGPFKHVIDDGLDLRKSSYDTVHNLLTAFPPDRLRDMGMLDELVDRAIEGLDDDHDIQALSCIIIDRLISADQLDMITRRGRLETLIGKLSKILDVKLKPSAVKQDIERQNEVLRNVYKTSVQINDSIKKAQKEGTATLGLSDLELSSWAQFYDNLTQKLP